MRKLKKKKNQRINGKQNILSPWKEKYIIALELLQREFGKDRLFSSVMTVVF